jgi:DNA-binding NarL/FixJ family response regulator
MAVRLLILVRERTLADALSTRLEAEQDVEIVAALHTRAPSPNLFTGSRANVLLIDGDLPDDAALQLCSDLSERGEAPSVILLSHTSDPRSIVRAIGSGAVGWVRKDESLSRLIDVIRGAARSETWLPPSETGEVLRLLLRGPGAEPDDGGDPLAVLTPREREVLGCLAQGIGRREVADQLHMSPNTVRTHAQNIMSKLGVHSTLEAVALTRSHLADQPPDLPNQQGQPGAERPSLTVLWPEPR